MRVRSVVVVTVIAAGAVVMSPASVLAHRLAATPATQDQPVRVGGSIAAPQRILDVAPVYPDLARDARVQGVVIAEAVIAADGSVSDAKILKSIPLLDEAALTAIHQWRYTPTLLNGRAVPVIATVTVNFSLDPTGAATGRASSPFAGAASDVAPAPLTWNGAEVMAVGGGIKAPARRVFVDPVAPALARAAGVTGVVIVQALIDTTGRVVWTKVLKSVPLLDQAALDAVAQWEYTPTLINGVAVPVTMTVTVNFQDR